MVAIVPALSEDGWVESDGRQAEYLFSHFFLSDYSQTYIYDDQVASLAWIIAMNDENVMMIPSAVQSRLEKYFSRYFNNVVVQATIAEDSNNANKYQLTIYLSFVGKDGIPYNLSKLAFMENGLIKKVIDLNNG